MADNPLLSALSPDRHMNPLRPLKPELMKLATGPDGPARPSQASDTDAQLRKAAEDFEAVFMGLVLKQMRSTVHREEFLNGGIGEEFFTEMLDEEFAKATSGRSASGIGEMLYSQLKRMYGSEGSVEDGNAVDGMLPLTSGAMSLQHELLKSQAGLRSLNAITTMPAMP